VIGADFRSSACLRVEMHNETQGQLHLQIVEYLCVKCLGFSEVNIVRLPTFYSPEHQCLSSRISGVWRQLMDLFSIRCLLFCMGVKLGR